MMNNEEKMEYVQEGLSDDLIMKLVKFREHIMQDYESIDRRDPQVVGEFLDNITSQFGDEHHLRKDDLIAVREILQEDLNSHDSSKKNVVVGDPTEKNGEKIDREAIKELIAPNLESATSNYVKFVQPFEGTRAYKQELDVYYKHQRKYLAEDLGIVQPRERDAAMEVLVQEVREKAATKEPVQRTREEITQIQKKIAKEWIERVQGSYAKIVDDSRENIEQYWDNVFHDISEIKGLNDQDKEKIYDGVRYIVERIISKGRTKDQISSTQEIQEEKKELVEENILQKPLEFNNMTFEGEQAEMLREMHDDMIIKKNRWITKSEAFRRSQRSIRSAKLEYDTKKDEELISTFKKEYEIARNAFFNMIEKYKKKDEGVESVGEVEELKIREAVDTYNDVSEARSKKFGDTFKNALANISTWFKKMPRATKRIAMTTFLVAGLTVGAIAAKDKFMSSDVDMQKEQISTEQAIMTGSESLSSEMDKSSVQGSIIANGEKTEVMDGGIVEKEISGDGSNEISRVVTDTVVIEKGGSVEGSIANLLVKHHAQIMQERQANADTNEQQVEDWAKKEAHIIANNYTKNHAGIDIDHVNPGTKIYVNIDDAANISADIAFVGGPHITPEKTKIKKEVVPDNANAEIEHIRSLLKKPEFHRSIAEHITSIFGVENIHEVKSDLSMSINDLLEKNPIAAEKIARIEKNALNHYSKNELPEKSKSVQNYLIRLYAKAVRDDLVQEVFYG